MEPRGCEFSAASVVLKNQFQSRKQTPIRDEFRFSELGNESRSTFRLVRQANNNKPAEVFGGCTTNFTCGSDKKTKYNGVIFHCIVIYGTTIF